MRFVLPLLVLASCATTADAQQVAWKSEELGRIVYAEESGSEAVFAYKVRLTNGEGRMFIEGLAGEFGGPGPLDGYWSEPDAARDDSDADTRRCPFAIVDSEGRTTRRWGRLTITFPSDDFPGDWLMLRGDCLDPPRDVVRATLER